MIEEILKQAGLKLIVKKTEKDLRFSKPHERLGSVVDAAGKTVGEFHTSEDIYGGKWENADFEGPDGRAYSLHMDSTKCCDGFGSRFSVMSGRFIKRKSGEKEAEVCVNIPDTDRCWDVERWLADAVRTHYMAWDD